MCEECINEGDIVEHRLNPDIFGIVIGHQGSLVGLRLASMAIVWFHEFELRSVAGDDSPETVEPPSNVVKVDFTKRGQLTKDTKTKGNA